MQKKKVILVMLQLSTKHYELRLFFDNIRAVSDKSIKCDVVNTGILVLCQRNRSKLRISYKLLINI